MVLHLCLDSVGAIVLFVGLFLKLFPRHSRSKPLAAPSIHQINGTTPYEKSNLGKLVLASLSPVTTQLFSLPNIWISMWKLSSTLLSPLPDMNSFCSPKWQNSSTYGWSMAVHWSKALESAWGNILSWWKVFLFPSREFYNSFMCINGSGSLQYANENA